MSADRRESRPESSERNGEKWSLLSAAFGAVSGAILSLLIKPLTELLPGKLFEEFLSKVIEIALSLGLAALFGFLATRIRRLDLFLRKYRVPAAFVASLLLSVSLWVRAGRPVYRLPVLFIALTMIETFLFLLFCGSAIQTGLLTIAGKQKSEYERQREADAQRIAAAAIAEGDPVRAGGFFGVNVAGALGGAIASGCLQLLLLAFHMAAICVVSALDAHELFRLSWVWSSIAGVIITAATLQLLLFSQKFGEQHAESVPLDEKYDGIQPDQE